MANKRIAISAGEVMAIVVASQYVDLSDEETEEDAEIDVEEDPESGF